MRRLLFLLLGALLATAANAQSPRLTAAGAVTFERAAVRVAVTGPLAHVEQTLTFFNPTDRVLEGELLVPLPEGATLSGYALDVAGALVDAVPVLKEQARIVFEEEVRRGVDPGLAEQVSGNVFRLRVYPLPARGRRIVRIGFATELRPGARGATLTVPLRFGHALPGATIAVESDTAVAATLAGQPLALTPRDGRQAVYAARRDLPETDLTVVLPATNRPIVRVDSFRSAGARHAERFFAVALPPVTPIAAAPPLPRRLGLIWDASLSRRGANRARELSLLKTYLARFAAVTVDVLVVRDTVAPLRTFTLQNGDSPALRTFLNDVPLDGGTDLSALRLPAGDALCLLFTDGNDSLGRGLPALSGAPVLAIASDARANHAALRALCDTSGGAYVNLTALTDAEASEKLLAPRLPRRISVSPPGAVADLRTSPDGAIVVGRLLAPTATLTLSGQTVRVDGSRALATGRIARYWAQRQAEALALTPVRHRAELAALGRQFGIVTPGTSLLVLETLEQHVRYRIPPPRTRPALYDAYLGQVKQAAKEQTRKDAAQIARLVAQWNEQTRWWERSKRFPAGFRPGKPKGETRRIAMGSTAQALNSGQAVRANAEGSGMGGMMGGAMAGRGRVMAGAAATRPRSALESRVVAGDLRDDLRQVTARSARQPAYALAIPHRLRGSSRPAPLEVVALTTWNAKAPYLKSLRAAKPADVYAAYLKERERYAAMPAFYLDCADVLLQRGRFVEAVRVLTSLTDLELEDVALLRIVARRLQQLGQLGRAIPLFERIRQLRPDEPQSLRDLALALETRGELARALALLNEVVIGRWNRGENDFAGIEMVALQEANRIAARLPAGTPNPLDRRLRKNLDVDLRITLTWDTDQTDMDLHIVEPSGEECFFGNPKTAIGGRISNDFTNGYGPEEYLLRFAMPGRYRIKARFYGSHAQRLTGATVLQASVITNFGRKNEKRRALTLRLTRDSETFVIGEVQLR